MNALYIGNLAIDEVPGSKLRTRRGVAAQLVRKYQGDVNLVDAFLAANPLYTTHDAQYPYLVLDGLDVTYDGPLATAELTFVGYNSSPTNYVPNLLTSGKWTPRSVYLNTNMEVDGEWLVNYYAPEISYKYTTNGIIDTPQYQAYSRNAAYVNILDSKQTSPGGSSVGPPNPSYVRTGQFLYQIYSVCTQFQFDQKGTTYNYAETWAVILQKPGPTTLSAATLELPVGGASFPKSQ